MKSTSTKKTFLRVKPLFKRISRPILFVIRPIFKGDSALGRVGLTG